MEYKAFDLWKKSAEGRSLELYLQACEQFEREAEANPSYGAENAHWFIPPADITPDILREQPKPHKISILMVGYSRPEGAMRAATSAIATADRPQDIQILICTDETDPLKDRYKALPELDVHVIEQHRTSDKWNHLFQYATGDIICLICDDVVFATRSWDTYLNKFWPDDGIAVVSTNYPCLLEFPIIGRPMAEKLGYVAPPQLTHSGLDIFWAFAGRTVNRYYFTTDIHIQHRHYEAHAVHNRNDRYARGHDMESEEFTQFCLTETQKLL